MENTNESITTAPVNVGAYIPQSVETRDPADIPLASIPLSQLMRGEMTCPVCNNALASDTKEMSIAGGIYLVCKRCAESKK